MLSFPGIPAYALVALTAVVNAVWVFTAGHSVNAQQISDAALFVIIMLVIAQFLNWRVKQWQGLPERLLQRLIYLLQGLAFLQIAWMSIRLFNHLSMTTAFGFADDWLAGVDEALGLNWNTYFALVSQSDMARFLMGYSYTSLTFLSLVAFFLLMVVGEFERSRYFLEVFLVTALVCTAAGMFFPAEAAVHRYLGAENVPAAFDIEPGLYHLGHMEVLRSGQPVSFDFKSMPGLVTFPSFHTAAGIVLMIALFRTRLFWISVVYSAIMIASTPVYGGHYFVDLFAGVLVAVVISVLYARTPRYRPLFAAGKVEEAVPGRGLALN